MLCHILCSGLGKMMYGNGDIYDGHWRDGQPNGNGLYLHANGVLIHDGEFKDGLLHGKGKIIGCNGPGSIYQGELQKVGKYLCIIRTAVCVQQLCGYNI